MPRLVTSGALLQCNLGTTQGVLTVPPAAITAGTHPVATIADNRPGNLGAFGVCNATNPPQPCHPAPTTSWLPGSPSVRWGALPVVHQSCQCQCQRGGHITILSTGQQTTTVAAALSAGPVSG